MAGILMQYFKRSKLIPQPHDKKIIKILSKDRID